MPALLNFVLFQFGWFAAVLGAAHAHALLGTLTVLLIIAWHLYAARNWRAELQLLLCAALIGLCADTALASSGWVQYSDPLMPAGLAPLWIIALWMLFATTLRLSLKWLQPHLLLGALCGAVGGPLAYLSGVRLGALTLPRAEAALIALAALWMAATVLLLRMAQRHA
ncbi:MAG: DUF2878 domain-containing protein [Steroidobacteraceae bacterium]